MSIKVGIALATYNSSKYICEQLDSLLNQSIQNYICYIHDDGSTDNTLEILSAYVRRYPNRFRLLTYPALGSAKKNFMSIANHIKEDYLMFCDHDDVWVSDKIEISLKEIQRIEQRNPNKGVLVFGDLCVVDEQLNVIWPSFFKHKNFNPIIGSSFYRQLLLGCGAGCTMIMNKIVYKCAIKVNRPDNIIMHDYWCSLVASAGGIVHYIDKPLLLYRQHGDNVWGVKEKRSLKEKIQDNLKDLKKMNFKEYRSRQQQWILQPRIQAEEIARITEIPLSYRKICREYSQLSSKNKLYRVAFYLKNGIKRDHNNLWLYFWC